MKKSLTAYESVSALKEASARKALIGGQLVFATMVAATQPPKGYVAQSPRDAVGGLLASFQKQVPKMYVYIHPELFELAKTRFALTVDAYLAWGLRQRRGETVVIGGTERVDGSTHIDVLVFDSGKLIALYDRELPERDNARFNIAVDALIQQVRTDYPKARIKQAAPLTDWAIDGVEYIGEKPLSSATYRPLSKATSDKGSYLLPVGVAVAGVLFNFAMIGLAWNNFEAAQDEFESASASQDVRAAGGVDSDYINLLTQRQTFMETPRRQDVLPSKVLHIVRGIGVLPGVQIISLQLPAPGISAPSADAVHAIHPDEKRNLDLITADRIADAQMRISVPRTEEAALVQAKSVLGAVARSTGMSLRLTMRGYQDDSAKNRRIFTIEGFIHG